MMPKGAEDGLRIPRHWRWLWKNCPSVPYEEASTAKLEIGEVENNSLRREPSAGYSESNLG